MELWEKALSSCRLPGHNSSDVSVFSLLCVQELLGEKDIWDRAASLALPAAAGSGQPPCRVLCGLQLRAGRAFPECLDPAADVFGICRERGCARVAPGHCWESKVVWLPVVGPFTSPNPLFFFPLSSRALLWIAFVGVLLPSVS